MITDLFIRSGNNSKIKVEEFDLEEKMYIKGLDENEESINFSVSKEAKVHIDGKEIQIAPRDRQFGSKSVFSRFLCIFGGPMFNILLALLLFFSIAIMVGVPSNQVIIGEVTENSPAEKANLEVGDKIIGINDVEFDSAGDLILMLQNSPDKEIDLNIVRDENEIDILIIPENKDGVGIIGIRTIQVFMDVTLVEAVKMSFSEVAKWIGLIFDSFKMLFAGDVGIDDVAGPVGIVQITSDAAKAGIFTLMNWTAILSLYLGVFNLLPIPALDGSRLLFLLVEAVRKKPVDPKKESLVHFIGFAFLMLLMILITVNDVTRLFE